MSPELLIAILGTGGLAAIIPKVIDGIRAYQTGRAEQEKQENRSALSRLANAEERADNEASFRRRIEEWAGGLVYMLKQIGVPESGIPPKPERKERVSP